MLGILSTLLLDRQYFPHLLMKKLGSQRTIGAMPHVSTYQSWNSNPSLSLKLIVFLQYFARSENNEGGCNVRNVHELYF